jgi:cation transport ATPase
LAPAGNKGSDACSAMQNLRLVMKYCDGSLERTVQSFECNKDDCEQMARSKFPPEQLKEIVLIKVGLNTQIVQRSSRTHEFQLEMGKHKHHDSSDDDEDEEDKKRKKRKKEKEKEKSKDKHKHKKKKVPNVALWMLLPSLFNCLSIFPSEFLIFVLSV